MMHSRRQIGRMALGGMALAALPRLQAAKIDSTVRGVKMGLITGSLNPLPDTPAGKDVIDTVIEGCLAVGAANIELVNLLEPRLVGAVSFGHPPNPMTPEYEKSRTAVREWRLTTPVSRFREIRKKFDDAGLNLFSYVMTFDLDFTDEEIDAVFKQMQALKVGCFCTNQSRVDVAPRLVPFAEKYKIKPAWHPHAAVNDSNEVATPASMEKLLALSKQFVINLDIGHFTAGNNDAVDFLKKHHDRITHIHIKDRKRNGGPNVALGAGDTPIRECLTLIRDNKWPIYGIIEREYRDAPGNAVEQTRAQMEYLKQLLNS
ncbi:MAG TPA: sugar phosphate isomerase/epimerase [Bryobacteraceae bacterium]|nr:sugar phosphate isomerase/epimerase [Bryobacteraceae bacterium]